MTPDELAKMQGIDPASHKKHGPHPQLTFAEIKQNEADRHSFHEGKEGPADVSNMEGSQLSFLYNGILLEAKITDLGGELIDPIGEDDVWINLGGYPDELIADDRTFPLSSCESGATNCDWRALGAVSPVKNQGGCGSCWSFAAAGMVEADYFIQNGPFSTTQSHIDLSEQQDVDCIFGHGGCGGGNSYDSWGLHAEHATSRKPWALEEDYPYKASFQSDSKTCDFDRGLYVDYAGSYHEGDYEDPVALKNRLLRGPVVVYLWASDTVFVNYTGGVITDNCTNSDINHAVLAVGFGYDEEVGEEYFLVKNSWGGAWGRQGFIKIGVRGGNGVCGITFWNHYQIKVHSTIGI